jgi:hypothetical protein
MSDFNGTIIIEETPTYLSISEDSGGSLTVETSIIEGNVQIERTENINIITESDGKDIIMPSEKEREIVVVTEESVQLVSVAEQGIAGIKGEQGERGADGNVNLNLLFIETEYKVDNLLNSSYNLDNIPMQNSINVFINGLKQHKSEYSVNGTLITLLSEIHTNDIITFTYYILI